MLDKKLTNEEKLDLIYKMTQENHEILASMRRQQYFSYVLRIIYWLVILGVIGGAYYYVYPMIGYITGNATKIQEALQQLQGLKGAMPETELVNTLIDGLKKSATSGQ